MGSQNPAHARGVVAASCSVVTQALSHLSCGSDLVDSCVRRADLMATVTKTTSAQTDVASRHDNIVDANTAVTAPTNYCKAVGYVESGVITKTAWNPTDKPSLTTSATTIAVTDKSGGTETVAVTVTEISSYMHDLCARSWKMSVVA